MIVIKKTAISFIKHLNEKSRQYVVAAAALTTVLSILICLMFSGTTLSYNIIYDGKVVAQVSEKAVYENALDKAEKMIVSDDNENLLANAKIKAVLSTKENADDEEELAKIILNNSSNVKEGYILKVDGEDALYLADSVEADKALEQRLNAYNFEDKICDSEFASKVELVSAYLGDVALSDTDEMTSFIGILDVITVVTDIESRKIPFDTIVKKTDSKNAGYSLITTKGIEGIKELSRKTTYLNGQKVVEDILSEEVIKDPVNEVVLVGTASAQKGSANKYLSSGTLVYPTEKKDRVKITSYWGDGRNHKAIDIAGPVGTKIFASLSGTVVESRYAGDYGYYVLIDHGNGVKTRYAHCSTLYAKVGDTVTAGQTIALMGNTGYSTGPHLHFEVILNGTRVDPAPYLGLY